MRHEIKKPNDKINLKIKLLKKKIKNLKTIQNKKNYNNKKYMIMKKKKIESNSSLLDWS